MENVKTTLLLRKIQSENLAGSEMALKLVRQMRRLNGEIVIRAILSLAMPTFHAIVDEVCEIQAVS